MGTMGNMERKKQRVALCHTIMQSCRVELCELFPYLDAAFQALPWQLREERGFASDGTVLSCAVQDVLVCYHREPAALRRGYLHVLLHYLYLHPFSEEEGEWWDIACDIAVEQLLERQERLRLQTAPPLRTKCLAMLGEQTYSAQQIMALLKDNFFGCATEELRRAFAFDDHTHWHGSVGQGKRSQWEALLLEAAQNQTGRGKRGSRAGGDTETVQESETSPYDYRKFLHQFTVPREEIELDTESFDYILYQYGMEHCHAMPLIEPLEYQEVQRLEELVIAIDTSHSCSRETVSRFLSETYQILSQRENFFRKMKVYFLQCDCLIQNVAVIHSREDWMEYAKNITIHGRGGNGFYAGILLR